PIMCVGERLEQNEAGETKEVVTGQVKAGLAGLAYSSDIVIAYEPIWAIGTGRAATGTQANETIGLIRQEFAVLYGKQNAAQLRILYGGSVTADNIAEFVAQDEIDGGLVGGASLKADQFVSIVRQTRDIKGTSEK
ncbi:MAG: triose-phosphate isomerase, partial [Dehalococcoidales bacterium]|nr:triose-phosphate isomerase [Dehalococcoidales bacterium]